MAEDLTDKDVILNIEYDEKISMPLERIVPILLEGIPRYRTAFANNHYKVNGQLYTAFSYHLITGMIPELMQGKEPLITGLEDLLKVFSDDSEKRRRRPIVDLIKLAINEAVYQYNQEKIERGFDVVQSPTEFINISEEAMDNWIYGQTLTPRDWQIFQALANYSPSQVENSKISQSPDWSKMTNWRWEADNKFYVEYTVLVTYHRVFSRVLSQHDTIIEIPDLPKSKSKGGESIGAGEVGYANQIRGLLRRVGLKREDKAVAVVYGNPVLKKREEKATINHKIRIIDELPQEDNYLAPSKIGQLVNEEQQLMLTLFTAAHNYLVIEIMDVQYQLYPDDEESFKRYVALSTWRFLSDILPGDNIIPVNLEYHELLNFGFNEDLSLVEKYRQMLHQAYNSSGLDEALTWSYELARERIAIGEAQIGDESQFNFVTIYPELYPTFNSALEKMVELRPVVPQRYSELLRISKMMQLSKDIKKFKLIGLDDYKLNAEEFAEKRKEQSNLKSALAYYFGASSISIN